jgi:hypothetical protein
MRLRLPDKPGGVKVRRRVARSNLVEAVSAATTRWSLAKFGTTEGKGKRARAISNTSSEAKAEAEASVIHSQSVRPRLSTNENKLVLPNPKLFLL